MALISAVYKWRLDNATYVYITNENGGEPFVNIGGSCDEEKIKEVVITWDEQEYCERFEGMVSFVHSYENGRFSSLQFLDCSVYLKDYSSCDLRPSVPTDITINTSANTVDYYISSSVVVSDEGCVEQDGEKIKTFDIVFNIPKGIPGLTIKGTVTPSANGFNFPNTADINDGYIVSRDSVEGEEPIGAKRGDLWICTENTGDNPTFEFNGVNLSGPKGGDFRYDAIKNSYMFGEGDVASGVNSITEGINSVAAGDNSHAEGQSYAYGKYSHAEGSYAGAQGRSSHAEGNITLSYGQSSHAEGSNTYSEGESSHAEGSYARTRGFAAHAEGIGFDESNGGEKTTFIKKLNDTDKENVKNTYGIDAEWVQPSNVLVDGKLYDIYTADGETKLCSMTASLFDQHHLVYDKYGGGSGWNKTGALFSVDNDSALSDGATYVFKRKYGAFGNASHTEGVNAFAVGDNSHAEGDNSMAIGKNSHAEGSLGGAYGNNSHVEGCANTANGINSHAEGRANTASGSASHAEGDSTLAIGDYSHAEGLYTLAVGNCSHAEGKGNVARNEGQHVCGTYATIDETGEFIFQVGIGTDDSNRKDAFVIKKDGSFIFYVTEEESNSIIFTSFMDKTTIKLKTISSKQELEYSHDNVTWHEFTVDTKPISLNEGQKMYVRGVLSGDNTKEDFTNFYIPSGSVGITGEISSLFDYNNLDASLKAFCCYNMFSGCVGLTGAPELPATTLSEGCYSGMFSGCVNLGTPPDLPATTLAKECYRDMFSDCHSSASIGLRNAPELPATILAEECYSGMFRNCNNLTTPPELPATTLAKKCYYEMFSDCAGSGAIGLTSAPELPATTLAEECYSGMFRNCINLGTAPELPATTLAKGCYREMFYGCSGSDSIGLTSAPELPATTLAENCYSGMFNGCDVINEITCFATDISANDCTLAWLEGVSNEGVFYKDVEMLSWEEGVNGIPLRWEIGFTNMLGKTFNDFETLLPANSYLKIKMKSFNEHVLSVTGGTRRIIITFVSEILNIDSYKSIMFTDRTGYIFCYRNINEVVVEEGNTYIFNINYSPFEELGVTTSDVCILCRFSVN